MFAGVVEIVLGGTLIGAAMLKLRDRASSASAFATFGIRGPVARLVALSALIITEIVLGVGVALGSTAAAYGAAVLMALFAVALVLAVVAGKSGEPCGCFGSRSTVGYGTVVRSAGLAFAFVVAPSLSDLHLSTVTWLIVGVSFCLAGIAVLAAAVLALAREVGLLRMRIGPASALEIAHEGPEVGGRTELIEHFDTDGHVTFAIAVFSSAGCRVCQALGPTIRTLSNDPALAVRSFDEVEDSTVWRAHGIPGAPYAVAMDLDGTVLSKGTFNTLGQLESIVSTAADRSSRQQEVAVHA